MKIAVVTDDGKTISQHFGRAAHFLVAEVDGEKILSRELRANPGCHGLHAGPHEPRRGHPGAQGDCHGQGAGAEATHHRMVAIIADCEAIIAGGMGWGSRESLSAAKIRPIITDITEIDAALLAYAKGAITDHAEWVH
jgi:predicted Fe-Mo cluster-binding NifX family protein